jgi:hypothetical protein
MANFLQSGPLCSVLPPLEVPGPAGISAEAAPSPHTLPLPFLSIPSLTGAMLPPQEYPCRPISTSEGLPSLSSHHSLYLARICRMDAPCCDSS